MRLILLDGREVTVTSDAQVGVLVARGEVDEHCRYWDEPSGRWESIASHPAFREAVVIVEEPFLQDEPRSGSPGAIISDGSRAAAPGDDALESSAQASQPGAAVDKLAFQVQGSSERWTRDGLMRALEAGQLPADVAVKSNEMIMWLPANTIPSLMVDSPGTSVHPPSASVPTEYESTQTGIPDPNAVEHGGAGTLDRASQAQDVHPWLRYWARLLDGFLGAWIVMFFVVLAVGVGLVRPESLDEPNSTILGLMGLGLWHVVEGGLITLFGTTPGKYLMNIRVVQESGQRLPFGDSLGRSFGVWWTGLGAGLPIVSLFTMLFSRSRLLKHGKTKWDEVSESKVLHGEVGPIRWLGMFVLLVGMSVPLAWLSWLADQG